MNIEIVKNRMNAVLRPDSITTSNGDFLLTHVKLEKLDHATRFKPDQQLENICDEEKVYENIILNPNNIHKFIVVYGQSGTGKSHLIRWFNAKLMNDVDNDEEVVLFVSRSDNTLKGTIKQLVNVPEIRESVNNETYKRLMDSSSYIDAEKLKRLLYYQLIAEVENDDEEYCELFLRPDYKRIPIFLKDEVIQKRMLSDAGPIKRIYSKVDESDDFVDRDVIAEFIEDDFSFPEELYDDMMEYGSAKKARDVFNYLSENDDEENFKNKLTLYLNKFIGSIIRTSVGIQTNDFQDMFLEIREELAKQGKNLILLIEDITSFTGVDDALLNALMTEHTGTNDERKLCRVTSVVGTTIDYFSKHFRDNHRDRVTDYIFIPDDVFSDDRIFEFVGKYLNAMSLDEDVINEWVINGAQQLSYPKHNVVEGKDWEYVNISNDISLPLYPFTKQAILNLYDSRLTIKNKTPRYIIREIIEPVIREFISDKNVFPSLKFSNKGFNHTLKQIIDQQIDNNTLKERLFTFMDVWGNGTYERTSVDNEIYLANIKESIYIELNLPLIMTTVTREVKKENLSIKEYKINKQSNEKNIDNKSNVSLENQNQLESASTMLYDWIKQGEINLVATSGITGKIKTALEDLFSYISDAIDWQAEGVSLDHFNRIKDKNKQIIKLEGQIKSEEWYTLPKNNETIYVLLAMLRYSIYGRKSWNYDGADYDIYTLNLFVERNKSRFINYVKTCKGKVESTYINAAMSLNVYYSILTGQYTSKTISNLNVDKFMINPYLKSLESNSHSFKWISLINKYSDYEDKVNADENTNENKFGIVLNYYNIIQGTKNSKKLILDSVNINDKIKELKKEKLVFSDMELQLDDYCTKRKRIVEKYIAIQKDILEVANTEKANGLAIYDNVSKYFSDKAIEKKDFDDMWELFKNFLTTASASNHYINYSLPDRNSINISKTIDAYNRIREVRDIDDPLTILLYFSTDPIKELTALSDIINKVMKQVDKVESDIEKSDIGDILKDDDFLNIEISNELSKTKSVLQGGE